MNKAYILLFFLFLVPLASARELPNTYNATSLFHFEEASGNFLDSVGTSSATLYGGAVERTPTKYRNGLYFNSNAGVVVIGNEDFYDISGSTGMVGAIGGWYTFEDFATQILFDKVDNSSNIGWTVFTNGENFVFSLRSTSGGGNAYNWNCPVNSSDFINTGFHSIIFSLETKSFYIDGVKKQTDFSQSGGAIEGTSNTVNLVMGGIGPGLGGASVLSGKMDEVFIILNRPVSEAEIYSIYKDGQQSARNFEN